MFKILIITLLVAILVSLFSGAFFLTKDASGKQRVATALTIRIVLSISLLVLIVVGAMMGYITPNSLGSP
jgi:hypothetical protein